MRIIDENTKHLLNNPSKRWRWIKFELKKKRKTITSVANDNNVNPLVIHKANTGCSVKAEIYLSEALDMNVYDLFPDRYDEDNLPKECTQ